MGKPPLRILVTGASRGIGREISKQLLNSGHKVAVTSRTFTELETTVAGYESSSLIIVADSTDTTSADSAINKVSLGRPWSPTASVTYLDCWMGQHIIEEGWNNWKNPANELTARYREYNSSGPGGSSQKRVSWSKQLTSEQALAYSNEKILGAWRPGKK